MSRVGIAETGKFDDRCELLDEDVRENELSLREGFRLLSSYPACECAGDSCGEHRVWIITEADRSATMILLPEGLLIKSTRPAFDRTS